MEKTKLIYVSLLLLGVALIFYAGSLLLSRAELEQPQRSLFIKQGEEYIVRVDIVNNEPLSRHYKIRVLVDGRRYDETIFLSVGRPFTYTHHIYPPLQDKKVDVLVYKENEPVPVSEATYIIE